MESVGPGRPRSEAARRAILDAATALLIAGGPASATMEAIARKAGVSKQTVYRWWPAPAAIIFEVVREGAAERIPMDLTDDFVADVRRFIRRGVKAAREAQPLLAALMAEAQRDQAFRDAFKDGFLAVRRGVLADLLEHGVESGHIRSDAVGLWSEFVFAAIWYRILGASGPLDRRFADQLTDAVLAAMGLAEGGRR